MPRKRNPLMQQMLDAVPKAPVNTTVTLPQDFIKQINEACRRTGIYKYEFAAAAFYSLMRRHNLMDEDLSLEPYVRRVEELVRFAQAAD